MRRVAYNEEWGDEHRVRESEGCSSNRVSVIRVSDLRPILHCFALLSPKEQEVFICIFCQHMTPSQVAEQLGWTSRGAVVTAMKRINEKLAPCRGGGVRSFQVDLPESPEQDGDELS